MHSAMRCYRRVYRRSHHPCLAVNNEHHQRLPIPPTVCMPQPRPLLSPTSSVQRALLWLSGGGGRGEGIGGAAWHTLAGRAVLKGGVGGEGVWNPKVCVPKMARQDFPSCEFHFFPRWSLWSGGLTPPPSSCGVRPRGGRGGGHQCRGAATLLAHRPGKHSKGGEGESGTQQFAYQKWPDKIFPAVNLVFPHDGHFGLEGGGPPWLKKKEKKNKHRPARRSGPDTPSAWPNARALPAQTANSCSESAPLRRRTPAARWWAGLAWRRPAGSWAGEGSWRAAGPWGRAR